MSYSSIQDDNDIISGYSIQNKIEFAPELSQGKRYLTTKNNMVKSIRRRNNKVEGFDNMGLDESLQLPVKEKNNSEIKQLVSLQNSFEKTLNQWNGKYNELLSQIDNNKGLYQQCLDACNKHKDRDLLTACIYGCTSGKYISAGAAYRGPAPPPAGFLSVLEVLGSAIAVAGILAAVVALGPEIAALAALSEEAFDFASLAIEAAQAVSSALSAAGTALTEGLVAASEALSAISMAASSMFGTVFDAQVFAEAFSWAMTLGEAEIGTLMSMSFMVGSEVITGLALYEMYKKTCGLKEEFKDLSIKDKQKMAVFLKTLPGAPKFEEIITPKQVKKSKPVNKKLIYYHSKEGFTGGPESHSISSVSGRNQEIYNKKGFFQSPSMGDYGPDGFKFKNGDKIDDFKKMVNKKLSSNPQLPGDSWFTGKSAEENANTSSQINSVNPDGIRANMTKATDAFSKILKTMPNDPLIVQMQQVDIGPDNLTATMEKLESQWRDIFNSVCKAGIDKDDKGSFAGHQQYCNSWTNTMEGRSGYFGDRWIVDNNGNRQDNKLIGKTFNLNNNSDVGSSDDKSNSRMGCDIVIPGTRTSDSNIGGAGFCECTDGSKIYMDEGHPNITCNDMCYPENIKNKGKDNLLYHDSSVWKPTMEANPGKVGVGAFNLSPPINSQTPQPWLNCGVNGSEPKDCPSGMKQVGDVKEMKECGAYKDRSRLPFWEQVADDVDIFGTPYPAPSVANKGRVCVNPLPSGGSKSFVGPKQVEDNGMGAQIPVGYKKLASPSQLASSCSDSKYPNIYIEILALRALEIILGAKTEIMSKVIKRSNDAKIKTQLKQSESGRRLLRNLKKYQKTYNKFQKNQQKSVLLNGMIRDLSNKKDSANISYYLWFALAISGMLIVIKNIKN
jgi:hypothetical protein